MNCMPVNQMHTQSLFHTYYKHTHTRARALTHIHKPIEIFLCPGTGETDAQMNKTMEENATFYGISSRLIFFIYVWLAFVCLLSIQLFKFLFLFWCVIDATAAINN